MELASALLAYVVPAVLITMLPGPDTAMVLATSVKAGQRAAVRAAWGVGVGILLWASAAAAGLAAVLNSSTVLYDGFRLVCAAYLLILAYQSVRGSLRRDASAEQPPPPRSRKLPSVGWGFRRALLTCVLNPKLGVFFVVVLPQFVPTGMAVGPATLALGTLHAAIAVLWYLLVCALASAAGRVLSRQRVRVWLDRTSGAVFLGFGVRLAVETR